jgi:peptidoglycan/xylan/chitin deacetylase (PgdA/CDA1 family)
MFRLLKRSGHHVLTAPVVHRAAVTAAAIRGRRLVFVFHRVIGGGERSSGIVPAVTQGIFRRQLEEILELGDIVPLTSMLEETLVRARPRFALTFDDDYLSHFEVVLPILQEREVTATFFVGGRSLHGLGPLWFETLDALALSRGIAELGRWLGIETNDLQHLAHVCERDRRLQRRIEAEDAATARHLEAEHIAALADAGMTIGFHSLDHRLMTGQAEHEIDAALTEGRSELEDVVGDRLQLFAYPHGKADGEVARRVRHAGYVAAWTGRPRALAPRDDPYLLGRWEAGSAEGHDLGARIAAVLNRWAGA